MPEGARSTESTTVGRWRLWPVTLVAAAAAAALGAGHGGQQSSPPARDGSLIYTIELHEAKRERRAEAPVGAARPAHAAPVRRASSRSLPDFRQVRVVAPGIIDDLRTGDFNRDNRTDIVTIDKSAESIRTYRADRKLAFARQRTTAYEDLGGEIPAFAPFKKPAILDLAVTGEFSEDLFGVLPGRKSGRFKRPRRVGKEDGDSDVDASIGLDLDGDGRTDLAVLLDNGDLLAFRNRRRFRFDRNLVEAGSIHDDLTVGDVNGDGNDDILGIDLTTDTFTYYESQGDGSFREEAVVAVETGIGLAMYTADLDGDGNLDVVGDGNFFNDSWTMLGDGDGGFAQQQMIPGEDISGSAVVADFTGDGIPDLAAADLQGVAVWEGQGDGGLGQPARMAAHMRFDRNDGIFRPGSNIAAGDFDRDGRIDIVGAQFFGSNSVPTASNLILFINGGSPVDLRISNLRFSELLFNGSEIILRGSVDFSGSDGEVYSKNSAAEATQTAFISFSFFLDFPFGLEDFRGQVQVTGNFLDRRREESGTIDFDLVLPLPIVVVGAQPAVSVSSFSLWDNNLVRSNELDP